MRRFAPGAPLCAPGALSVALGGHLANDHASAQQSAGEHTLPTGFVAALLAGKEGQRLTALPQRPFARSQPGRAPQSTWPGQQWPGLAPLRPRSAALRSWRSVGRACRPPREWPCQRTAERRRAPTAKRLLHCWRAKRANLWQPAARHAQDGCEGGYNLVLLRAGTASGPRSSPICQRSMPGHTPTAPRQWWQAREGAPRRALRWRTCWPERVVRTMLTRPHPYLQSAGGRAAGRAPAATLRRQHVQPCWPRHVRYEPWRASKTDMFAMFLPAVRSPMRCVFQGETPLNQPSDLRDSFIPRVPYKLNAIYLWHPHPVRRL